MTQTVRAWVRSVSIGQLIVAIGRVEQHRSAKHRLQRVLYAELYRRGGHGAAYCMGVTDGA